LQQLELKGNTRTATGNGPARVLRRNGRIPAVLYGPGSVNILLSVDTHELELVLKKGNIGHLIFNLSIQNGKTINKPAMIKELQTDPVTGQLLHADFYEIDMKRKIRVNVPVRTTGKSIGVEMGGLLQIVRRELEVLCLPGEIPQSIDIDISQLDIGSSVHVNEITLDGEAEIPSDVNFTVLTILSPKKEHEKEAEDEEGEAIEGEETAEDAADSGAEAS
jgi:large subunit ribosomal protein L25